MALGAIVLALSAALLLLQEGCRRANRWVGWGVFLGLPLVLTPFWVQMSNAGAYPTAGIFPWIKLCTIELCAGWVTALRFTALARNRWALACTFLLVTFNLLEAVGKDLFGGHLAHFLVAATGTLLVLSLPHPKRTVRIATVNKHRELYLDGLTRAWIFGYTLWNWTFIYLNFPGIAAHQLGVLMPSFFIGIIEPRRWLQARTYTLALDLLLLATFPQFILPLTDSSHWATPYRENIAAAICLAVVAANAAHYFLSRGNEPGE